MSARGTILLRPRGDEDNRPAVARGAQHANDALHHALRDPEREIRLQRRPHLA